MRLSLAASALLTVALVSAQSSNSTTDCVSEYTQCLSDGGADNTCESNNAKCKNRCADTNTACIQSGEDESVCVSSYNMCLDSFSVYATAASSAGQDCVSLFSSCHDEGIADNTCNSYNAQCKDKCSTIYSTCLTSGQPDSSSCSTQYNNCLDSFSVFETEATSTGHDCVYLFGQCKNNGTADNTCNSYNAQCKDKCSVMYGTCLSSGNADDSMCMSQYNNCLDAFTESTSLSCTTSFSQCRQSGTAANECASLSATCKNDCSISYSTCLSSGDADESACLSQYDSCLVSFEPVANSTDCVTMYQTCENDGNADNDCSAVNAQCKTDCSTNYSTCLSSGDSTLAEPCLKSYNQCLVSFEWTNTTSSGQDCVSKYMSCDGDDNACEADAAQCKNTCSTSYSTCLSSGDESLDAPCLNQYDSCLVSFNTTTSVPDCTSEYLSCDETDNVCSANNAQCKNTCSVALDICESSGDKALIPQCQKQYSSCLVSFSAATAAIGEDCVREYLTSTEADNTAEASAASCKNRCATAYDTCNTSNSTTTGPQCLSLYDRCLVSLSSNDTTPTGQDCASKYYACGAATNTTAAGCNSDYAQCANSCGVAQDICRSSGDDTLISLCDGIYNTCLDPSTNSNITTNATIAINATTSYALPTNTARVNLTAAATSTYRVSAASGFPVATASGNYTGHFAQTTASASFELVATSSSSVPLASINPGGSKEVVGDDAGEGDECDV